jgi:hypothetical protein
LKLAEALQLRADLQKRLLQIRQRIAASARHQEGEAPPEDPNALLIDAERGVRARGLIRGINRTNVATEIDPDSR